MRTQSDESTCRTFWQDSSARPWCGDSSKKAVKRQLRIFDFEICRARFTLPLFLPYPLFLSDRAFTALQVLNATNMYVMK